MDVFQKHKLYTEKIERLSTKIESLENQLTSSEHPTTPSDNATLIRQVVQEEWDNKEDKLRADFEKFLEESLELEKLTIVKMYKSDIAKTIQLINDQVNMYFDSSSKQIEEIIVNKFKEIKKEINDVKENMTRDPSQLP